MTLYLEQYLDKLQSLPGDLAKNLKKLRELDLKAQLHLCDIDRKIKGHLISAKGGGKGAAATEQRQRRYDEVKALMGSARQMSEEKVKLANDTYEMVDKHIRKLDADLSRFELDLKRKLLETKQGLSGVGGGLDDDGGGDTSARKTPGGVSALKRKSAAALKRKANDQADTASAGPKKKRKKKGADAIEAGDESPRPLDAAEAEHLASLSGAALFHQLAGGGGVDGAMIDMPVDPNEPTYCVCHQVSFGEMVGCDNTDCPIEWFHFGCVGLTTKPKGRWYCPRCLEERKHKK